MNSFQYRILSLAAFLGLTSIIIGAMGAHFFTKILSPSGLLSVETGVRYQMYHALTMLALTVLYGKMRTSTVEITFYLFAAGTILFSFSLYIFAVLGSMEIELPKILYLITPLGGLLLSAGWAVLLFNSLRHLYLRNSEKKKS